MFQSPGIGKNSNEGISDFRISGQSFIEGNCELQTSDDIDMKFGPVIKLDKKKKKVKKIDDDVMSENCVGTAIFPIYGQIRAIRKANSGRIVCKTYSFINNNLLSYKN